MSVSRRRFLRSGAMGALSAGLILKSGSFALGHDSTGSNPVPDSQSIDPAGAVFNYSRASFEPHIGSTFRLRQGKRTVDLMLVDLTGYQASSRTTKAVKTKATESFVLAFQAPRSLSHPSSIFQLEHSKLGKFDLFLTCSENRGKTSYTAVVNRIV